MCAHILALLEQDENSRQVVSSLTNKGHTVALPATFLKAIELLKQRPVVDLIISDVHLENGGSVFDFLRWVRRNTVTASAPPFVMFSFKPDKMAKHLEDGIRTSARLLGAARYISMDRFDEEDFGRQIESLLPPKEQKTAVDFESDGEI